MKKIGITLLLAFIIAQGFSQVSSAESNPPRQQSTDTNAITKVVVGNDRLAVVDNGDKINVKVGNRGLSILESLEGKMPKFEFEKYDRDNDLESPAPLVCDDDGFNSRGRRGRHFKGHWSGVELGFNNFLTDGYNFDLPAGIDYMNLNSGKAMNFNINFTQLSIGIFRHVGFVTGLGLNWNNYRFDGNNNIEKDGSGNIVEYAPAGLLKKSKLSTLYLDLPFMLEIQVPTDHKRINIAAGPIGAIKVTSHTKMVFEDGDKVKSDGDFNLNLLRYGATARIGYDDFQLYGTYYLTPLFKEGRGPGGVDLYPFEIGVSLTFN
jgi:hypothetical protein